MKLQAKLLFLLLVHVVGCAAYVQPEKLKTKAPTELNVRVMLDASFTLDETLGAIDALEDWQTSKSPSEPSELHFHLFTVNHAEIVELVNRHEDPNRVYLIRVPRLDDPDCLILDAAAKAIPLGQGVWKVCLSSTVPVSRSYWHSIVAHEVGHALGLQHTKTGIMSIPVGEYGVVTCEDRQALAARHGFAMPVCAQRDE